MMWLVYVFIGIGLIFQTLGILSLFRFPDVYTRLHGTTMCTTFGSIFIYLGVVAYGIIIYLSGRPEYLALPVHTIVVMIMVILTNPVGSHAIARAAHRSGVMPKHAIVDVLAEHEKSGGKK
jgi:multicomponent Na+:H+ antiporter subunit G